MISPIQALALSFLLLSSQGCWAALPSPITFNKDIAPIIYRSCASCHHESESTPFNLITYREVAKRAQQITNVTSAHYMPPWPPQSGDGYPELAGSRRLNDNEVELIRRWVSEGAIEGAPGDLSPAPHWNSEWQLGSPDLVLAMDKPYEMAADGKDVYRNFVIPNPETQRHYVRAVEFRPEGKSAHHVFIKIDHTRQSRLLAATEQAPGFPGPMSGEAEMPGGQFLTWQPGKIASISPEGMPWILEPGTDIVLESHLRPIGRVEPIRFKVGLYFTNRPCERTAFKLGLFDLMIDIPPGATNYLAESSFQLPVDCEALSVLPHCHWLGREVEGSAELPDGSIQPLLLITNWDFNWQGDYRFKTPVKLPKGTVLRMRIAYDNSTNNARNPNNPPRRVRYGPQFTDEMAELSFLLLPAKAEDEKILNAAYQRHNLQTFLPRAEADVQENPNDANARLKLASMRMAQRKIDDARTQVERAIELDPNLAGAHYWAGLIARVQNRLPDAEREFVISAKLDPSNEKTWGNLGLVRATLGNLKGARESFQRALEVNPSDEIAREMLNQLPR